VRVAEIRIHNFRRSLDPAILWNLKDSVRAAMLSKIRRPLAKRDYPHDSQARSINFALKRARLLAGWKEE
jgi:hypothetical protein